MTQNETNKILAVLKASYPQFYRDMEKEDAYAMLNLWTEMFEDDPYELVATAVKAYISTDSKGYPPAIGAIREKIRLLTEKPQMTDGQAWNLVMKAMRSADKSKAFKELPDSIQKCIGSASILRDWAVTDIEKLSFIQTNFQRTYRTVSERESEVRAIPENVRRMLPQNLFLLEAENG